jgi:hypothetical protein
MPPKWRTVLDLMIIGGLDFVPAMESAGYSESYINGNGYRIRQDMRFCEELTKGTAARAAKSEDRRERRLRTLDKIIDDPAATHRDIVSAVQVQGRMCGWLSETIRTESTERQQALDAAARQEAARLSFIALDTRQLPDVSLTRKTVQSVVLSNTIPQSLHSRVSDTQDTNTLDSLIGDKDGEVNTDD